MSVQPLNIDAPGRSRLRAMLAVAPQRRRTYLLRALVVGLVLAALWYVCAAVVNERLPKTGPTRLLYMAHDTIWLWLRGVLWTQYFPYSLVWAIPALGALLFLAVEACTPFGITRLHRRTVLGAARLPGLAALVFPRHGKQPFDKEAWRRRRTETAEVLRGGFILRVLHEHRVQLWTDLRGGPETAPPSSRRADAMIAADLRLLRCAPPSPRLFLNALETLAMTHEASASGQLARLLRDKLGRLPETLPDDIAEDLRALVAAGEPSQTAPVDALAWLHSALMDHGSAREPSGVAFAARLIAVARGANAGNSAAVRSFLALWARGRLASGPQAEALRTAETLIDFDYWAYVAETAAAVEDPGKLLRDALPGIALVDQNAEGFAWTGRDIRQ